jgi:hypothetical protein
MMYLFMLLTSVRRNLNISNNAGIVLHAIESIGLDVNIDKKSKNMTRNKSAMKS